MAKPLVRRVEVAGGHIYLDDRDQKIPGVTTILGCLPKGALETWKLRKAVDLALAGEDKWSWDGQGRLTDYLIGAGEREAFAAAKKGSNAHDFCEKHIKGEDPVMSSYTVPEQKHIKCYLDFVRDYQPEPVLVEKVLTYIDSKSNRPLFCGTNDLIAKLYWNDASDSTFLPNNWIDGETWLVDWKASSGQVRASHALQAAFYAHSTHWLDNETGELNPMIPVDKAAIVLLNGGKGGRGYRAQRVDISNVVFSVCKSLLRIYEFSKIEERTLLERL